MLSYSVTGSLNHPPLLFLHGFLGVKEDWEEVVNGLKEKYCCYCFDLPGHGKSPTHPHLLESLFTAIHSLGLPPAPLIGYSMGGRMALFLKHHFPNHFQQLILLGAHPGLSDNAERQSRLQQDLNWCDKLETQPFACFLEDWYAQAMFSSLCKNQPLYVKLIQSRLRQNPKNLADVLRNFSLGLQPELKIPEGTLLMYGEEDLKFEALYRTLSSNHVIKIPKSGHLLPLENPQDIHRAITQFLEKQYVANSRTI
jgi:2-succinyl-6-hydroxy-2,4-cyclohexadiene-1-carboxylate synthase